LFLLDEFLAQEDIELNLPRDEVASVLASGFYNISERALKPVTVRDLALEGMRGLATIDPNIGIDVVGDIIRDNYVY